MHGAEHLLGELHIPLVGFQNLLGVVAQVTQLEKRDHPRGEQQPDDTQESNGYSSSNSRHTRLTVKIVPNRPYRQGSPPTRTYPERCNKYNARQGQKQTCLNLTELQAVFRKNSSRRNQCRIRQTTPQLVLTKTTGRYGKPSRRPPEIQAIFAKYNAARRQGRIRPECRNEIHPNLRLIQIYEEIANYPRFRLRDRSHRPYAPAAPGKSC